MQHKDILTTVADTPLAGSKEVAGGGNRTLCRFRIKINICINYKILILILNVCRINNQFFKKIREILYIKQETTSAGLCFFKNTIQGDYFRYHTNKTG